MAARTLFQIHLQIIKIQLSRSVLATKGREVKQVTLKDPVVGSKQSKKNLSLGETKSQTR
jgi:hypothetical protein